MKFRALLSWYDEPPAWLAASIASIAKLGVTDLVAVDGAYGLYPQGRACSGLEQHAAIAETCNALGLGWTIHAPAMKWAGNEVEKRSRMFELALVGTTPEDWLIIMDADQIVTDGSDLRGVLGATDLDVANVTFWERRPQTPETDDLARRFNWPSVSQQPIRIIFRALPGMHCETNHYTYVAGDGRRLWGNETDGSSVEPCLDLTHVRVEHRTQFRELARQTDKRRYYQTRDRLGIERGPCYSCGAVGDLRRPIGFEIADGGLESGFCEICEACAPDHDAANVTRILELRALVRRDGMDVDLSGLFGSVPGLEAACK